MKKAIWHYVTNNWYVFAIALVYILVESKTIWEIHSWHIHDDAHFLNQAKTIAKFRWLGDYSQYTLMKGPGFSIFLAISKILLIPLNYAVMFFNVTAAVIMFFALKKIFNQTITASIIYIFVLFHPYPGVVRIIRELIHPGQALIVFSLVTMGIFTNRNPKVFLGTAGFFLGWHWATREEGIWILPGISILILGGLLSVSFTDLTKRLGFLVGGFLIVPTIISSLNLIKYRTFSIVDMKEKNYQNAVNILTSVSVHEPKAFVPVTKANAEEIYKVSPTYNMLKPFFNNQKDAWEIHGCQQKPSTCGEIAGGWYFLALRDAVEKVGFYKDAKSTEEFYESIYSEVKLACDNGRLNCKPSPISMMPKLTYSQYELVIPAFRKALNLFILIPNPEQPKYSFGSIDIIKKHAKFTKIRRYYPSIEDKSEKAVERIKTLNENFAFKFKELVKQAYIVLLPIFLIFGLFAMVLSILISLFVKKIDVALIIGTAAFVLALTRVIILVLIEISSYSSLTPSYMGAAFQFSLIGAACSIIALLRYIPAIKNIVKID